MPKLKGYKNPTPKVKKLKKKPAQKPVKLRQKLLVNEGDILLNWWVNLAL